MLPCELQALIPVGDTLPFMHPEPRGSRPASHLVKEVGLPAGGQRALQHAHQTRVLQHGGRVDDLQHRTGSDQHTGGGKQRRDATVTGEPPAPWGVQPDPPPSKLTKHNDLWLSKGRVHPATP